jgi:lipoprotein-anchoring transpeptidase ErfK/SrfK
MQTRLVIALAAALAFTAPAHAQFRQIPAPTMQEPDPGVDHTAKDADLDPQLRRQPVFYRSDYPAGTIIVNTSDRFLYLITSQTTALRYGIGVGRDGFQWGGIHTISRKAEWPDWTPPPEMIVRQPYLPRFMAGGPGNPMGAAALYIGTTVYRIHGTNAPETIGQAVSSGCFRLVNEDVADLYSRVPVGTKVVVQHQ